MLEVAKIEADDRATRAGTTAHRVFPPGWGPRPAGPIRGTVEPVGWGEG